MHKLTHALQANREQIESATVFLLRLAAAVIFIEAGGLKLFGWFGGMPEGQALTPLILTAGLLEVIGGPLILLGLFTRPVAFILAGEMAVAYIIGHAIPFGNAFAPLVNQGAPAVLLAFIFLFLAAYGAGRWSVDVLLARRRAEGNQFSHP